MNSLQVSGIAKGKQKERERDGAMGQRKTGRLSAQLTRNQKFSSSILLRLPLPLPLSGSISHLFIVSTAPPTRKIVCCGHFPPRVFPSARFVWLKTRMTHLISMAQLVHLAAKVFNISPGTMASKLNGMVRMCLGNLN